MTGDMLIVCAWVGFCVGTVAFIAGNLAGRITERMAADHRIAQVRMDERAMVRADRPARAITEQMKCELQRMLDDKTLRVK